MDNPNENNEQPAQPADLMGYEQTAEVVTPSEPTKTLDTQAIINNAIKEVTTDEEGKLVYPENMDPMLRAAVAASKSFRDTQSGFHKNQQSLKESEAENLALRDKLAESTRKPLELTAERQQELDDLMYVDPQAWRIEMNKLEQQSSIAATEALQTVTEEARQKAGGEFELERRVSYLEEFNTRGGTPITVDNLDNDVPKRINDKLANGEVSFEAYIDEVAEYLAKGKVVASTTAQQTADLNSANGGSTAQETQQQGQAAIDYSQMTF